MEFIQDTRKSIVRKEEAEVESVWKCSFIEEKARSQEVMNNNFFIGFIGK